MWPDRLDEISASSTLARVVWCLTLALLLALFVFLHAMGVSQGELPLDDAGTWGVATRSLGTVFTLPTEFHSQPPLYYLVLHFLAKVSDAYWVLRGLSFVCCLGLVAFVLFRAHELNLLSRVAFSLLFMSGELGDYLSTSVRPYGMAALLVTISFVVFTRLLGEPSRRLVVAHALVTLAALYTNAFVFTILPLQAAWLLGTYAVYTRLHGRRPAFERFRASLIGMAAVVVGTIPYLAMAWHYQSKVYAAAASASRYHGPLRPEVYWFAIRDFFLFPRYQLWLVIGLVAVGLAVRVAHKKWDALLWLCMGVTQIAFIWSFVNGRSLLWFQTKYMIAAYLAICFLAAVAFAHLPRLACRGIWLVVPIAVGWLAYGQYGKFSAFFAHARPLGYFQEFHKTLTEQPGKKVVFFDIGYDGQHLEYQVRRDRDIVVATMRGSGWASGGDNHLDADYVARVIDGSWGATRCFYYVVAAPAGPYQRIFIPRMRHYGYAQKRTFPVAARPTAEFCRP